MPELPLEISCRDAAAVVAAGEALLVDCRTPEEHAIAAIAGAILIPMQELPERLGELAGREHERIVVHCHHGVRSLQTAHWLRRQGFAAAQSMAGGIDAWSQEIDPATPRY
ncbi:MAG: rhodanese [Pirellulales bacterium]|nr:rhodanese [Pirellulales bacterium]